MITRRSFLGWLGSVLTLLFLPRIFSGENLETRPPQPGCICPVCASEDIDIDDGFFRCYNCGAEGFVQVRISVQKWSGLT